MKKFKSADQLAKAAISHIAKEKEILSNDEDKLDFVAMYVNAYMQKNGASTEETVEMINNVYYEIWHEKMQEEIVEMLKIANDDTLKATYMSLQGTLLLEGKIKKKHLKEMPVEYHTTERLLANFLDDYIKYKESLTVGPVADQNAEPVYDTDSLSEEAKTYSKEE